MSLVLKIIAFVDSIFCFVASTTKLVHVWSTPDCSWWNSDWNCFNPQVVGPRSWNPYQRQPGTGWIPSWSRRNWPRAFRPLRGDTRNFPFLHWFPIAMFAQGWFWWGCIDYWVLINWGGGIHQSIGDDDKLHDLEYPITFFKIMLRNLHNRNVVSTVLSLVNGKFIQPTMRLGWPGKVGN
jgi:hypothetical protein